MARRAPADERPFRPLDMNVLHSVVQHISKDGSDANRGAPPPIKSTPQPAPVKPEKPLFQTPRVHRMNQEKRVLYTRAERQAIDRLVNNLAIRLQTQLKASHVLRALTSLLLHAESQLDRRAGERGPITRPANGDLAGLKRFEEEIGQLLAHAIRDAGPLRPG